MSAHRKRSASEDTAGSVARLQLRRGLREMHRSKLRRLPKFGVVADHLELSSLRDAELVKKVHCDDSCGHPDYGYQFVDGVPRCPPGMCQFVARVGRQPGPLLHIWD